MKTYLWAVIFGYSFVAVSSAFAASSKCTEDFFEGFVEDYVEHLCLSKPTNPFCELQDLGDIDDLAIKASRAKRFVKMAQALREAGTKAAITTGALAAAQSAAAVLAEISKKKGLDAAAAFWSAAAKIRVGVVTIPLQVFLFGPESLIGYRVGMSPKHQYCQDLQKYQKASLVVQYTHNFYVCEPEMLLIGNDKILHLIGSPNRKQVTFLSSKEVCSAYTKLQKFTKEENEKLKLNPPKAGYWPWS